jgi:3-hydroxymyristoyl/3-hydroxydecanoyl-(acyl carrier protein) dehydratase
VSSLKFSSEKFLMIERVSQIDRQGGAWGLGLLIGHKQLEPDHWYFPCHFKDDQVMAGSLMAEGCGQLAMFYMLYLGMHLHTRQGRFQPLPGMAQKVRCRGQVLPQSNELVYRMEVTELGMQPYPFIKANIDILLNGKIVVDFKNLCVMIQEGDKQEGEKQRDDSQSMETLSSIQSTHLIHSAPLMTVIPDLDAPRNKGVIPIKHVEAPWQEGQNRVPDTLPFTPWHLFEFATGDISRCFGPEFDIYRHSVPPRTPCGDLQLVTRVVEIQGQRGDLKHPSSCVAEYEVPDHAWYFQRNTHPSLMPYSILMEISLQPNGFISGYMGTTLRYPDKTLYFRNLDGKGTLLRQVDLRGKTIVNDSRLLSTSMAGGSIIQSFTFELSTEGKPFYQGSAVFGYFSEDALTHQLGLDNGRVSQPWHVAHQQAAQRINLLDPDCPWFRAPVDKPYYRLAGGQLHFVDQVDIVEAGGKAGKGYLSAVRTIDAADWFFQFHFHQDPVMPGSLGVEAIIEIMQLYMLKNDLGASLRNPRFNQILSTIKWKYRGQITPLNREMHLDVHITDLRIEPHRVTLVGDANLSKDGLRIYEITDIALCLEEAD